MRSYLLGKIGSTCLSSAKRLVRVFILLATLTSLRAQDIPAPSAASDLSATPASSAGAMYLSWSVPGNDLETVALGAGSLFYLQYSTYTEVAWSTSTAQLNFSAAGAVPGELQYRAVSGLLGNTSYYFRIWTMDGAGNCSQASNEVAGLTAIETPSDIYFDEISSNSIVASAYVPSPAFMNLHLGRSGTNVAININAWSWAGWHGEAWTTKASMPTARSGFAAAAVNGKLYAQGGAESPTSNEEYDPEQDVWTVKASMPAGRSSFGSAAAGGRIFVFGGARNLNLNQQYAPVPDIWWNIPGIKVDPAAAAVAVGEKIYSLGGAGRFCLWAVWAARSCVTQYGNINQEFDSSVNVWARRQDMPTSRGYLAAAASSGKIYAVGGVTGFNYGRAVNSNEEYNPAFNSWTVRRGMSEPRINLTAAALGGKVYAIGGDNSAGRLNTNEEYDPVSDTWVLRRQMPTARTGLAAVAIGGRIYVVGGMDTRALNVNEEYDPGIAAKFGSLTPNTRYTFKAKARNQAGVETGESVTVSAYTLATIARSAGPALTGVYSSSLTVNWASGTFTGGFNGSGAAYKIEVSQLPDFSDVQFSSTTYGFSLLVSGLSPGSSYYFRAQAYNSVGANDHSWLFLGSGTTRGRSWPAPAGCSSTLNVVKTGSSGYSAIQSAVDDLPRNLSGNACVVVRDSQTYYEQVTVRGFVNNGYRLKIMADPALAGSPPVISPPERSAAAFLVANDSVTLSGFMVVPVSSVTYGIFVSSFSAEISSISVLDAPGFITVAGISVPGKALISYSTVTVQDANGFYIEGSGSILSYSAAYVRGSWHDVFPKSALYLNTASSNTVIRGYFVNLAPDGWSFPAYLYHSNSNVIIQSTMTGNNGLYLRRSSSNTIAQSSMYGKYALYVIDFSSYNRITQSVMDGESHGFYMYMTSYNTIENSFINSGLMASFDHLATYNTVTGSTITANITITDAGTATRGLAGFLYDSHSSYNRVERSYVSAPLYGVIFGGDYNTLKRSTVTGSLSGVRMSAAVNAVIDECRLAGDVALDSRSRNPGLTISSSALIGTGVTGIGLKFDYNSSVVQWEEEYKKVGIGTVTLTASRISVGSQGIGVLIGSGTSGLINLSAISIAGGRYGLSVDSGMAGVDLVVSGLNIEALQAGATAIEFLGGQFVSTFTGVAFNSGEISVNVNGSLLSQSSRITMRDAYGPRYGSFYERDPGGYVDWVPDTDNRPATVAVLRPRNGSYVNSLPQLDGTAADDVLVSSVQVGVMRESDGKYWNGAVWEASRSWLEAVVFPSSWTFCNVPVWMDGAAYTITSRAMDSSGNWSVVYATSSFVYDAAVPVSAVTIPADGEVAASFSAVSGTAADLGSAPGRIWVSIKRLADDHYWNGEISQWVVPEAWNLAQGSATWRYAGLSEAELASGTAYFTVSRAADLAGNVQVSQAWGSTFTYVAAHISSAPFRGVTENSLTVNWESTFSSGTIYYVRLCELDSADACIYTATTTAFSSGFTGLNANSRYYGYVSTASSSGYRFAGSGVTLAIAPSSAAFTGVGYSSAVFAWSGGANTADTSYNFEVSPSTSFNVITASGTGTAMSAGLAGLTESMTYYGRARGVNSEGVFSAFGAVASVSTLSLPQPPAQLAAPSGSVLGVSSIAWSWSELADVTGYNVYSSTAPSALMTSLLHTAYLFEGLVPNTTYGIMVAGVNSGGEGPLSLSSAVFTMAAVPSAPFASVVGLSSAVLNWELNGNPAGTVVELWRASGDVNYVSVFSGPAVSYADTGLEECSHYSYKLRGRNGAGIYSDFSLDTSFATDASAPAAPGGLYAGAQADAHISLNWDFSPGPAVTQYKLYFDSATGTIDYSTPYAVFSSTVSAWTTPALNPGSTYMFGLRALNRCGIEEKNTSVLISTRAVGALSGVRAVIKVPQTGKRVNGNSVTVIAELVAGTPAETRNIRFQYKASSGGWLDVPAKDPAIHPNPDAISPYFIHWDVATLAAGSYQLRAVATDLRDTADSLAEAITITVNTKQSEINENSSGDKATKEQEVHNFAANTLQAADPVSSQITKLEIPAGALNAPTATVAITNKPAVAPPPPADAEASGIVTEVVLSNQSLLAGGRTAVVTLLYPDADNNGIVDGTTLLASQLEMYSAHSAAGPWERDLKSVVDLAGKKVTGHTTHFSFFALFAPQAINFNAARAYPLPWRPGSGGKFDSAPGTYGITFDNLPGKTEIKIFTIGGQLVRELKLTAADLGVKVWDGKNSAGVKAASGVYLAHIKSGSSVKVLKIAVER